MPWIRVALVFELISTGPNNKAADEEEFSTTTSFYYLWSANPDLASAKTSTDNRKLLIRLPLREQS